MAKPARTAAKRKRNVAPAAAPRQPAEAAEPQAQAFPIIGIGASAGGYEAFVQLLQALPPDTGMAFVLIMHLDPEHKSMLAKLLGNLTHMPVTEARNGLEVQPNQVYVIPHKAEMGIRGGILQIVGRRQTGDRFLPVDYFLSSLAEDRHGRAIGVILSGTGSDGTVGLKAIKAEGGITLAQDEDSAKYFGMPGSAIAAGCVDFVLPPDRISEELERLARHPYVGLPQVANLSPLPAVGESDFRKILFLLRSASGVDFTDYKPGTIRRRIARRMVLLKIENLKKYLGHLQLNRRELDALFEDILIHVTGFFREPEAFKILQARIFPKILAGKRPGDALRIWIPGCSTGEEVYSLAIALLEFLGDRASSTAIQAFGTDISEAAIERARAGAYVESSLREVSPVRLRRFFTKTDSGYRVNKTLREMCVFARQDITKDPPFSRMDLVSCRNVLIYMGAALQKRVVAGFHYALREGGFLILGKSEALTAYAELFVPVERKARVFSKRADAGKPAPDFAPINFAKAPLTIPIPEEPAFDPLREADRLMWQRFAHAGLVLNDDLQIIHFRGDTSPFVSPASGKASLHVLRMVKEELKMELRSALHRARRTNSTVRSTGVRLKHDGSAGEVDLEVAPMHRPGSHERFFLVLFDRSRAAPTQPPQASAEGRHRPAPSSREVLQLRRELDASREYVQSVVEQQEASNEELKSANEEILSSNEELQSTNEELETAKEELQSTNEELVTLNETQHNRNAELAKLTDDLNNVLEDANIPILIIGDDGRVRRFTSSAGALLNLLPSDVGRPISNIRPNVIVPDWDAVVGNVIRTFTELQQEVQDNGGRWYSMRVRPYRTSENKINGVLIALVDIDAIKRSNQALSESEAMVRGLVETLARAILMIDRGGTVTVVNAAAEAMFGYQREDLLGKSVDMLLPARLRAVHAQYRAGYFAAPRVRPMGGGMELTGRRKDGGEFPVEVSLSYVQTSKDVLAVAFVEDLTKQRGTEAALAEKQTALLVSEQQLRTLTASLLTAQEEERARLASEIHDDLNQRLAALALQAWKVESQLPESKNGVREQVHEFRLTVEKLAEDLRRVAHELHPSALEHFGLANALRSYCEEFSRSRGVQIRYRQRHVPENISQDVALCLYRVTQEALANVTNHSGAKSATVVLAGVSGGIRLAIHDEGVGFDASVVQPGLGLTNMRERARILGGSLSVKTGTGEGTRIEASVPLGTKPAL